jgi:hypothetical protein
MRSGLWGPFRGDNVFRPISARHRAQVGMRDRHDHFLELSSCLPAHRLERKGSGERRAHKDGVQQVFP